MIDYDRRRFLGTAAMTIAATQLGALGSASAQAVQAIPTGPFGPIKQIYAGFLNVGYVESGPAKGPAVVLLHGWPYDIHTYVA